ncbi:MAG: cysteine synthase A [Candidatus Lokiarchaeota archaeon]|nr:cysteine synthase A [Candidatus Lokiarchaeota archaeon]
MHIPFLFGLHTFSSLIFLPVDRLNRRHLIALYCGDCHLKKSILECIGKTPIVQLGRLSQDCRATLAAKLEMFNPISIKDRPVLSMIAKAEKEGLIDENTTIIEATSGNTGMALAYICAVKGYRLIICMNEAMSDERKRILRLFGAELELTPPEFHTAAAKERAMELHAEISNSFYVNQHGNSANKQAHIETTAEEIWRDTEGEVDIIVAALGTTGTAMGVAEALKPRKPSLEVIGVEPKAAPMISEGSWEKHKLPGTSPGFVPDLYEEGLLDEIITIDAEGEAYGFCRRLAAEEGILAGISSGATAAAAVRIGKRSENEGKLIVAIFADSGQRYLSVKGLF